MDIQKKNGTEVVLMVVARRFYTPDGYVIRVTTRVGALCCVESMCVVRRCLFMFNRTPNAVDGFFPT